MTHSVAVVVGSASQDSLNRRLARALQLAAPESLEFIEAEIADLPFYRPEFDADYPEIGVRLKQVVEEADALLFVTPEYNRSIPAVLKNSLEWLSRPKGTSALSGKPAMMAGATPGGVGTAVAQAQLRSVLTHLDVRLLGQPELYVQISKQQFDDEGRATREGTQDFLATAMRAFADHIGAVLA
ncbi:NADPH-dependent FMN reductase [Actinomyces provencensis]|uniref:NADPH-dependent FMN reductase n=1 Tax=Actinomyces provencensis TaxID=1720198 RepID=UPI00096A43D4|nr:NADPH-dependent FMN reductase [Actinomyces provencensis]